MEKEPEKDIIKHAAQFASHHHSAVGQKRKYTNEDYIVHPAAVAAIVSSVSSDPDVIAAAWLHDTIEDTKATYEDILHLFGLRIASLVMELTNPSKPEDGNRAARKAIDLAHIEKASPAAKTIKLADIYDNLSSIIERDPEFAKVYLKEKAAMIKVLREGDAGLYTLVETLIAGTSDRQAAGQSEADDVSVRAATASTATSIQSGRLRGV